MKIYYSSASYYRLGDDFYIDIYDHRMQFHRGIVPIVGLNGSNALESHGWVLCDDKEIENLFGLIDMARL